jgi:predicted dehydrogenase
MSNPARPSRRDLLRTAGAGALASAAFATPSSASSPSSMSRRPVRRPRGDVLRVGLVGCGGRGTGAALNALLADPDTRLVALADAFPDYLESCHATLAGTAEIAERVDVPPERRFVGWDAYRGVIDACDVVLLATSPHFRPLHLAAAVDAGRHLFVEKPIAVDAPGVRAVHAACQTAREKSLSVVTGLCYRYQRAKRETIARIRDGAVGDIVALQCNYNAEGLWHRGRNPEWSEMEYQMRNWIYFTWLSGDHIAEQHIHSLDKLAWAMGDEYPVRCTASGGRAVRTGPEYGNVYDHFNTVYEWANGVRGYSSCRQWSGTSTDVSDWVLGTRGKANIQAHRIDAGPWQWRYESDEPDDMYQNEHDELFAAIRAGKPINDGDVMCKSTLMAIAGRLSAYTGRTIGWDEAWNSQESLAPATYEWGPVATAPIAQPGITQFS